MTPDEVRMLDNRYALLFIRGEFPVKDLKYDIMKHPYVRFTADGSSEPYAHGLDTRSIATLTLLPGDLESVPNTPVEDYNYVLFSEEELEEYFNLNGGKQK
jgi:type IV secretion system protein VirD4